MKPKKLIGLLLVAMPSIAFWFWHFDPDFGRSWAILGIMWLCIGLSIVGFLVGLVLAIKNKSNVGWWAVTALSVTPTIDFFFH